MARPTVVFFGQRIKKEINSIIGKRVKAATIYFSGQLKKEVSRKQATRGTGLRKRGLNPSAPGNFPKMVSGRFRSSIAWEYDKDRKVGRVGSDSIVAFWLEFGTKKMKRRPWLTLGILKYRRFIRKIITGQVTKI